MITETEKDLQVRCDALVRREVHYCISHLISELSKDDKYIEEIMEFSAKYDNIGEDEDVVEALEHWIVSDWLADKLSGQGEMITKDFMGMTIWGRTTSGQAISMDYVIEKITEELS